ncbi:hypothetical protein BDV29DRAFT_66683 [Aspergillus leporis]|jgi:hypothetical protein|uniref:Uncharacterized protein n=1 Tax=Aspergillus leporis TaxID=41062 RepID=A0A5N5WJB9_9EURO|nr:hypothetical protein BDV29DRAFT_66683 [Aspergillus leporis]
MADSGGDSVESISMRHLWDSLTLVGSAVHGTLGIHAGLFRPFSRNARPAQSGKPEAVKSDKPQIRCTACLRPNVLTALLLPPSARAILPPHGAVVSFYQSPDNNRPLSNHRVSDYKARCLKTLPLVCEPPG